MFHAIPDSPISWLRLDLLDAYWGGNKIFKLRYHIRKAKELGITRLISFGGAYSNHLFSLAHYGAANGFETIGVIRGERPLNPNPGLLAQEAVGMKLHFVSREAYRHKTEPEFQQELINQFGPALIIPEGGNSTLGALGAAEIVEEYPQLLQADLVLCAVGTACTLSGLGMKLGARIIGIPVLKAGDSLIENMEAIFSELNFTGPLPSLLSGYEFGGYAKTTPELLAFKEEYEQSNSIPLDPVYTAKLAYASKQLQKDRFFEKCKSVVLIHSGGYRPWEISESAKTVA